MCVVSNVMQGWGPVIPQVPPVWPQPSPYQPSKTAPQTSPPWTPQVVPGLDNELLKELIETFKAAKAAAERADEITGQPDCVDPEKAELLDRVAELERRLELVESDKLEGCSPSPAESSTSTDVTDPSAYLPPESPTAS